MPQDGSDPLPYAPRLGAATMRQQDRLVLASRSHDVDDLFHLSPDLMFVAKLDGFLQRVNPAVEALLGYTEHELLTRPYLEFIHPDDREQATEEVELLRGGTTMLSSENRLVCKDGSSRWIDWITTPAPDEGVFYGIGRDVTRRRRIDAQLERLVDEQAALRRVATLVAGEASQAEVFNAVAVEIARLIGSEEIRMLRYEETGNALVVASSGQLRDLFPVGSRVQLGGNNATSRMSKKGGSTRVDDYEGISLDDDVGRAGGIRLVVATSIEVEGRLWGGLVTGTTQDNPLPPETESRLGQFTDLVATAIANSESRARADRLAADQAALRRVATRVAEGATLADVFDDVAREVARAIDDVECALFRYEGDGNATVVARSGPGLGRGLSVGARLPVGGDGVVASVLREHRPWRVDDNAPCTGVIATRGQALGIRSAVGYPIMVRGRLWGAMGAGRFVAVPLPHGTEARLAQFADLVATAIANTESRAEVERLAEEQAALRRVATLVAQGAAPAIVFDAVAAEVAALLDSDHSGVCRYEPGAELTVLAHRGPAAPEFPSGSRISHEGDSVEGVVHRTQRSARSESYEGASGLIAEMSHNLGVRSAVAAPVVVDGRLWGVISAGWNALEPPPADTEGRVAQFAQLLATAIANADSGDKLNASRARLLTAGDEARRRVVRDLHDGAQQRLVHTVVTVKLAQRAIQRDPARAESLIADALGMAEMANHELRELAHGILPAVLLRGGLACGVGGLVDRLDLAVEVDLPAVRFPAAIEASAYFIVAEALTNVVKHANATRTRVMARGEDGTLRVEVRDDGTGGADPEGPGLVGLADRATALGGRLEVESPVGGGTRLIATLPLPTVSAGR
jgi:PAS domain S-box-containing protein